MIINIDKKDDYDIIHINGEFNVSVLSEFEKTINVYLENPKHTIIDFQNITFIDSSAIGLLLVFSAKFKKMKKNISIANVNEDIEGIFNMMGFKMKFKIYETIEKAAFKITEL